MQAPARAPPTHIRTGTKHICTGPQKPLRYYTLLSIVDDLLVAVGLVSVALDGIDVVLRIDACEVVGHVCRDARRVAYSGLTY